MRKKTIYNTGDILGSNGCKFIKELDPKCVSGRYLRLATFKCKCGEMFDSRISSVIIGHTKSCGCVRGEKLVTHGLIEHILYRTWANMKDRCSNPNNRKYHRYGGRGITVCQEWRDDFKAFYDYVTALDDYGVPGYTLDREDGNKGYEPNNVRWADYHTQSANQLMRSDNISGYIGVAYYKSYGNWVSYITVHKKRKNIGYYVTPEAAVEARNRYIIENGLNEYKVQKLNA